METQNNFIFAILMLISTCSQNFMDTVNELSIDNNLENKKNIGYKILINEEGKILFDNEMISPVKIEDAINRNLKRDDNVIFNIIIHPDARYKSVVGILESIKKTDAKIEVTVFDSLEMLSKQIEEPPPRPSVPTASDEEFEDAQYDKFIESEFDEWEDWDEPPPREKKAKEFIAYDKAPRPKYGKSISDFLKYPSRARTMGVEGKVYIKLVDSPCKKLI